LLLLHDHNDITCFDGYNSDALCRHQVQQRIAERGEMTAEQLHQDKIWMQSFIPRLLSQVIDPASEIEAANTTGDIESVYHRPVTGLNSNLSGPAEVQTHAHVHTQVHALSLARSDHFVMDLATGYSRDTRW
jgi:hypothetical protein